MDNKLAIVYDESVEDDLTEAYVQQSYVIVLKKEEILELMENEIQRVSDVLSISKSEAIVLISHYGWDVNEFPIEWFGDAKEELKENIGLFKRPDDSSSNDTEFFCGVCFKSHQLENSESVSCGHRVCTFCWTEHINVIINENPATEWYIWLKCPYGCQASIDRDMIERFASDEEKSKYEQFLLSSYVDYHKTMKLCPASGCSYAIDLGLNSGDSDVSCLCLFRFCWNCREEAHSPVDCKTAAKWVLENTVPCPMCKRRVEHNQDFSLKLKCLPPCSYDFCWICRSHWTQHLKQGTCNIDDVSRVEDDQLQEMQESVADRCKDCFRNWKSNETLMQKTKEKLKQLDNTIEYLRSTQLATPPQLMFIQEAWLQVMESIRILKWSYAYEYYLKEDEKAKIDFLKQAREDVMIPLNNLDHCLENELPLFLYGEEGPTKAFNVFRIDLTELTSITRTHYESLVRDLENGLPNVVPASDRSRITDNGDSEASGSGHDDDD